MNLLKISSGRLFRHLPLYKACIAGALVHSASLRAQDALIDLPSIPTGFSSASSIYAAPRPELKKGPTLALNLASTYDSNVTQSSGRPGDPVDSDFIISPGLIASYLIGSSEWLLGTTFAGSYDNYLDSSDLSGPNYDLTAFGGYRGGKLIASFSSGFGFHQGINRYLNANVEQYQISNRAIARYNFSPKTAVVGSISQSSVFYQTDGFNDTSSFNAGVGLLWSATPLIDLGPGIRYGLRTQENTDDLVTIGPNMKVNYQLSEKVSLRSTLGLDFTDSEGVDNDTLVNWSFALNYKANSLWSLNLALLRDTQANPGSGGGFDEVTLYRMGYVRNIRRARLNLGVGLESRTAEGFTTASSVNDSFDYLTYDASLSMPIYKENLDATLSVRYRDQSSDDPDNSWDGVQTGLGLSWKF
ncbi:hypothetical protein ACFSSA_05435 [Luteolibacter algae]|uniref:Outer membrane beta-barrel protein n=1 Tax=Luteolibacter algae TaxID=454151 RepID=A0ABW5D6V3_9BACT